MGAWVYCTDFAVVYKGAWLPFPIGAHDSLGLRCAKLCLSSSFTC